MYDGMDVSEMACISIKNRTYTITADVELPGNNTNGVVIAQAGRFGGWTLYMKNGFLHHEYNYVGKERTNIKSTTALSAGKHILRYEFKIDSKKPGSGGKCYLYVDDKKVAEGVIPHTQAYAYSADEGICVGVDHETPVSEDYKEGDNKFTGKINVATIEIFPVKN
jgi:arylsulfatase